MISRIRSHWLEVLILLAALALGLGFRLQALVSAARPRRGGLRLHRSQPCSGLVPYRDAFDHKPPVIYFVYAIVDAMGEDNRLNTRIAGAVFMALTPSLSTDLGVAFTVRPLDSRPPSCTRSSAIQGAYRDRTSIRST